MVETFIHAFYEAFYNYLFLWELKKDYIINVSSLSLPTQKSESCIC